MVLQNRIDQTYQDKVDGKIGEEFWMRQNKKWLLDKEALTIQLGERHKTDVSYLKNASAILELAANAVRLFKNAKYDHKRRFTQQLFSNCFLKDGKLDLELKTPYNIILEGGITGKWRPIVDYFRTFSENYNQNSHTTSSKMSLQQLLPKTLAK